MTYMQKIKYAILPVVAAVGFAFSGLEARAQNNTMDDCATLNALHGDKQGEIRAKYMANMVRGFDATTAADEAAKKKEADVQRLERKIEQTRPVVQEVRKEAKRDEAKDSIESVSLGDKKINMFMCNYWKDFNGNDTPEFEEYVGVKRNFKKDELITYVIQFVNLKNSKYQVTIYNSKGDEVIKTEEKLIENDNQAEFYIKTETQEEFKKYLLKSGVFGSFRQVVSINGKYAGSLEFTIENKDNNVAPAQNVASGTRIEVR